VSLPELSVGGTAAAGENLIGCSAKELRTIRDYIRRLEHDHHDLLVLHESLRQSRPVRLAGALRSLRRQPLAALTEVWRVLFRNRFAHAPTQPLLKPRSFAALERRAQPVVAAFASTSRQTTLLAEIAERCGPVTLVSLRGCGPTLPDASGVVNCISIGPHDHEFLLNGVNAPLLLIDPSAIPAKSPWSGVFDVNNMTLNLAMAGLVELVRARSGRVVFARTEAGLAPPLLADFVRNGETVDTLDSIIEQEVNR
jgi:hypothetical protein